MDLAAESFPQECRQVKRRQSGRPQRSPEAATVTGCRFDRQGIAAILENGAAGKNTCHSGAANWNKAISPSGGRIVLGVQRAAREEQGRHRNLLPSRPPKSRSCGH